MHILRAGAIVCLALLHSASLAKAQEVAANPSLSKAWVIDVGALFHRLDGDLSATLPSGGGGGDSFSRLGLNNYDTSFSAGLRWRFSDRWRLDLAYEEFASNGDRGNATEIEFGRITIPAGYQLLTSFEAQTYSAFVGYSFSKDATHEVGGRLGLSVLDAYASVAGSTWVGGSEIVAGPQTIGVTALVPTLGLYATYALTDRLAFEGAIDGVAGSVGVYSGHYLQLTGGLKYWFTDTFAISGGYHFLDARTEKDGDAIDSRIDVRTHGAFLKASVGF